MSDFDREKYGDYEEAMKRLLSDPIFDDIEGGGAKPAPQASAHAPEAAAVETAAPANEAEPAIEAAELEIEAESEKKVVTVSPSPAEAEPELTEEPELVSVPFAETEAESEAEPERTPPEEYLSAAAAVSAAPEKRKRRDAVTGVFEWVESAIFAVVVVILLFTFIFRIVGIDGRSMVPTLQDNDRVVISNLFYTPETGDIIVLDTSEDTVFFNGRQYSKPLIKRVIATGGQTVEVTSSENGCQKVYVDGVELKEDYINFNTVNHSSGQTKLTVPEGYVFVMGDNRGESLDSRSFGCISENAIVGRALFRIFPLSKMGLLTTDDPYGEH